MFTKKNLAGNKDICIEIYKVPSKIPLDEPPKIADLRDYQQIKPTGRGPASVLDCV